MSYTLGMKYLQAMCEVAVCVREVGLQLEGGSVGLDGLGDVSRVLVDGGEVRVGICSRDNVNSKVRL